MSKPEGSGPAPGPERGPDGPSQIRADHSRWNWLLLVPIVIPLLTFLYNFDSPRLFGIPFFYWLQLVFVVLGIAATTIVYRATKARS